MKGLNDGTILFRSSGPNKDHLRRNGSQPRINDDQKLNMETNREEIKDKMKVGIVRSRTKATELVS
jgi:hypothetical protein